MAARGTESKLNIINQLLEVFPGSFITAEGKEVRIPMQENDDTIEIKVALTAAKDVIGSGDAATQVTPKNGMIRPGFGQFTIPGGDFPEPAKKETIKATQEELDNVAEMLKALNF